MKTNRVSERTTDEIELAQRLSGSTAVTRYDEGEHKEAWALAHALHDLETSSITIRDLVADLRRESITNDEIRDILLDIGEELREVLWHANHLKFYAYLRGADEP